MIIHDEYQQESLVAFVKAYKGMKNVLEYICGWYDTDGPMGCCYLPYDIEVLEPILVCKKAVKLFDDLIDVCLTKSAINGRGVCFDKIPRDLKKFCERRIKDIGKENVNRGILVSYFKEFE